MSNPKEPVSKDIEILDAVIRWLGEKFEAIGEAVGGLLRRIMPSRNVRVVEKYQERIDRINSLEGEIEGLTKEQIQERMGEFRQRVTSADDEDQAAVLDEILPDVFAMVREASKRTIGLRHYDVQLIGGMVLHEGKIAEMATGEGKTLVATGAAALNALAGKGVFVVTVNDYLAKRDRDWMAPVYDYLGLSSGTIQSSMDPNQRHPEYACDITYGTNNEFGFDYLRDNMKSRAQDQVQKHLQFAIIDEVDSILIDEARTPLIISGMPEGSSRKYYLADGVARRLKDEEHFEIKEKERSVVLTDEGIETAQKILGVPSFYEGPYMEWPHHLEQSLRAHHLYKLDTHYVKKADSNGVPEIVIVDEYTGRMMPGRRWSDGLHQAVEAKEGIKIREESQTLATITFQNYFRLYHKISGMTGTAITEAAEFAKIYELDVIQIPPNRPNQRDDHNDVIYRGEPEKYPAIVDELIEKRAEGRPVLVGTASIEKSELLSRYLTDPTLMTQVLGRRSTQAEKLLAKEKKISEEVRSELAELLKRPARMDAARARELADQVTEANAKSDLAFWVDGVARAAEAVAGVREGIPHNVLNAKFHQSEAEIVAQAGREGAVTIATNMAGRGTDILLGGNPDFLARDEVRRTKDPTKYEEYLERFRAQCAEEKERVLACGGLHVLGTERHSSRRIDNQLRGRTARQGDPGSSRFYLSLQDDLMRIFANDRVQRILEMVGMTEDVDIQSPMVSRSIQRAQKKVESRNFEQRKSLLEYDEVMDKQRKTIYGLRQEVLEGGEVKDRILDMVTDEARRLGDVYLGSDREHFDIEGCTSAFHSKFGVSFTDGDFAGQEREPIIERLVEACQKHYESREEELGGENMRKLERYLLLNVIDGKWKDHLQNIDALRAGVGLRSMGQIDPKNEFKKEGFRHFEEMLQSIADDVTNIVFRLKPPEEEARRAPAMAATAPAAARPVAAPVARVPQAPQMQQLAAQRKGMDQAAASAGRSRVTGPIRRKQEKVGRNDACPCGSGKKFKKCCGVNQ